MLINHSLPGEMVPLEKHPVTFQLPSSYHQKGHLAVKLCFKPERIYVMSNIVERSNGTATLYEGVVNGRTGVGVGPI